MNFHFSSWTLQVDVWHHRYKLSHLFWTDFNQNQRELLCYCYYEFSVVAIVSGTSLLCFSKSGLLCAHWWESSIKSKNSYAAWAMRSWAWKLSAAVLLPNASSPPQSTTNWHFHLLTLWEKNFKVDVTWHYSRPTSSHGRKPTVNVWSWWFQMMFCFLDTVLSCVYFSFDELPTKLGGNKRRKNKTKKLIVSVDVSSAVQWSCSSCYYNRWGWNDSNANRRRPLSSVFSVSPTQQREKTTTTSHRLKNEWATHDTAEKCYYFSVDFCKKMFSKRELKSRTQDAAILVQQNKQDTVKACTSNFAIHSHEQKHQFVLLFPVTSANVSKSLTWGHGTANGLQ